MLAVICTALWGSAIPVIKIGYDVFNIVSVQDKLLFAGVRFMLAGLLVVLYSSIVSRRVALPARGDIKGILILGFVQTFLEYIFFYISLVYLTGVKGSILNSTGNFFAVFLAHIFFNNDRLNLPKICGCILGFAGVVLCCIDSSFDFSFTFLGDGFIIIAALMFAIGSIISKKLAQRIDSAVLTGWQLIAGGVALAAVGLVMGGSIHFASAKAVGIMAYLAMLSAVAFTLWTVLLKHNPVGKIAVYNFLNPVFGVLLSGVLLGENIFSPRTVAALALVCAGIYVVNSDLFKRRAV
jgi:drug/metabolite transporter (DMT)-like permease